MGGELSVASQPGVRTVFTFQCPLRYWQCDNTQSNESIPSNNELDTLITEPCEESVDVESKKTVLNVLAVDDDKTNRMILKRYLDILGHRVTMAVDGLEALNHCNSDHFDLIILDIQMPVMDGLEAMTRIRVSSKNPETPIIVVTANLTSEEYDECTLNGADCCLSKPISIDDLAEAIHFATGSDAYLTDVKTRRV